MRIQRSADQWRQILRSQQEQGQKDTECARENGVCVASLRNWRKRLRESREDEPVRLVEVASLRPAGQELRVTLPNGVMLSTNATWPLEHLVKAARMLSVL